MTLKTKESILKIKPYKAGGTKAKGKLPLVKLSSNENPLGPSPKAIEAFNRQSNNLSRYPDSSCMELKKAIGKVNNLDPEKIICGAGSDEIISLLCMAYAGVGDEVIHSQYGFLMYSISTLAAGATPVVADEDDLTANVDNILNKITDKTKIVFIANPNNPTGTYINKSELLRLRKNLAENILLVIDGAYSEYISQDDYSDGANIVDLGENTVMTRTFSKIYGLPALRVGWAYCPKSIVDIFERIRGPFNLSSPAIACAIEAIKDVDYTKTIKQHNDKWLKILTDEITNLGLYVTPSFGNFILVHFGDEQYANLVNEALLENDIIVRQMHSYKLPHALRISIGNQSDNTRLISTLQKIII